MSEQTTLKPCPFCDEEARLETCQDPRHFNNGGWWVECRSCHACTAVVHAEEYFAKEHAAELWNERVGDEA